jgi:16S rRNA processing protein RimM
LTLVTAGRVGKPHGLDGSFYVERPRHELPEGMELTVAGRKHLIERRAGSEERPLIRLAGLDDPGTLRGELLLVDAQLEEGEWLADDLVGLSVPGLGTVSQVIDAPSCSLLELEDGTLIPLVSDAILSIDPEAGRIEVNRDVLG